MNRPSEYDINRLRRWLALFFVALAVPSGILIQQAYSQIKWETFHQHRLIAEELAGRIDSNLRRLVDQEEARSFTDYQFIVSGGGPDQNILQRSPLSSIPPPSAIPGAIGYFQVDSQGILSTPLLPQTTGSPAVLGFSAEEFQKRIVLQHDIRGILSRNKLVGNGKSDRARDSETADDKPQRSPENRAEIEEAVSSISLQTRPDKTRSAARSDPVPAQAAFDRLNSLARKNEARETRQKGLNQSQAMDLKNDYSDESGLSVGSFTQPGKPKAPQSKRFPRKERVSIAEPRPPAAPADPRSQRDLSKELRILTFESEIDPFEFSLLDSGHFVLIRKVWREQQRYIQGMLIDQQRFLNGIVDIGFEESSVSQMSDLIIAYQGSVLSVFNTELSTDPTVETIGFRGALLFQTRLTPPFNDIDVVFRVTRLPPGPGSKLVIWIAVVWIGVLIVGTVLIYRAGVVQIKMTQQQRNFVSAVSHELKTPLTSIRMYSEMLRAGWTTEEKKLTYYDYILNESERLTRLINNVLQLAKLGRGDVPIEIKAIRVRSLLEAVRQKVLTQTDGAGFRFDLSIAPGIGKLEVETDLDAFIQIFINLVDNAIKFSRNSEQKIIELGCTRVSDGLVCFSVRDYGPGVAPNQINKIFKLFYRPENELTRETVGTGIGLALVQQLARRMKGRADVINRSPGAEFRITLPLAS